MKFQFFGVTVRFDITAIFLLYLFFVIGYNGTGHFFDGLLFVPLALLSLLVHERMHAFAGARFGIACKDITLFALGGGAALEHTGKKAWHAFVIAFIGPLTSGILGFSLLTLASVFASPGAVSPWVYLLFLAGYINILWAIFNLLPIYPLDGGRILHSVLWGMTRRERIGRVVAVWVGRVLIVAFLGWTLALAVSGSGEWFSVFWYGMLGFFLWIVGSAELKRQ